MLEGKGVWDNVEVAAGDKDMVVEVVDEREALAVKVGRPVWDTTGELDPEREGLGVADTEGEELCEKRDDTDAAVVSVPPLVLELQRVAMTVADGLSVRVCMEDREGEVVAQFVPELLPHTVGVEVMNEDTDDESVEDTVADRLEVMDVE